MCSPVWAADTSGSASLGLALQMYCGAYNVLTGNLGLMLGLLIAAYGLWILITDGSFGKGLTIIVAGALLTALPGLTSSFIQGMGDYLYNVGISSNSGASLRVATDIAERSGCSGIDIDWNDFDMDKPNYWTKDGGGSQWLPDFKSVADGKGIGASSAGPGKDTCRNEPPNPTCVSARDSMNPVFSHITPGVGYLGSKGCFGARQCSGACSKGHGGVDLACKGQSIPVYAGVSGVVATSVCGGDYGCHVEIDSGGGKYLFAHFMARSNLRPGDSVNANTTLGACGETGNAQGKHVHIEYRPNNGTPCRRVDPYTYLGPKG